MSRRFPLAAVLRVRRVQESLAGAEVQRARAAAAQAAVELDRRERRVDAAGRAERSTDPLPSTGWAGVMASRISLAGEAAAARVAAAEAEADVAARIEAWAQVRSARRGVERLADRHAEGVRAADHRVAAHALDEHTGTDHHRRTTRGRTP